MGRPVEFDRDVVLERAMQVFWAKGYKATSLQDLLQAMNLSKSSFYQTFFSKHQLFQQSINHYRDYMTRDMLNSLQQAESGRKFIEENFRSIAAEAHEPPGQLGCFVMNSANEFAQQDPVIADLVARGIVQFERVFLAAVKRAQVEGDIAAEKNAQALARYLVSSRSGLKTIAKAGASQKSLKEVIAIVLSALD